MNRFKVQGFKWVACWVLGGLWVPSVLAEPPYAENALSLESGMLWAVGSSTPIHYKLVPNQLVWRSGEVWGWTLSDGSRLAVRTRVAALATWVADGPENYYLGANASPSLEWWAPSGGWSVYAGAGGGVGWVDAQGVEGGQGQDFTLNWFARAGVEWVLTESTTLSVGGLFMHHSNGGKTNPNPGIDALGVTMGVSWRF